MTPPAYPPGWDEWDNFTRNNWLSDWRRGTDAGDYIGSDSTLENFWEQITTDPLDAPLDGFNRILKNSFISLLGNPFVLILSIVGGYFLFRWLAKKF